MAEAENRFGRLDVLVLNAGIIQVGPAEAMTGRGLRVGHGRDVLGRGARRPRPRCRCCAGSRGRLLAVTSVGGKLPAPHLLPYTAAKHAAVGFAEGLRVEAIRARRVGDRGRSRA